MSAVVALSFTNDRYTHLVLIAPISVLLIYLDRERIFRDRRIAFAFGIPRVAVAGVLYFAASTWLPEGGLSGFLWLRVVAILALWIAVFALLYGPRSTASALFPLCFLLFLIPIPAELLDRVVYELQSGSAGLTHLFFEALGVPVLRNGFTFSLPGIDIQIAQQCSGIRSSWGLLITGALAGHLFLRSPWAKSFFILLIIPVAILKNALRITTLSYLGVYVDRGFLLGPLHHRGGALFALLGSAILVPLLLLLRKLENRRRRAIKFYASPAAVTVR